ncbi:ABC transporter ATP-binding protein [Pseudorhodoferax sp.]|uniref:ABC transporter ATP-binding protein n=1 Tax=Pseudorhodoferax sp. TaxID=1993553 RepID=UPI002DD6623A|nr:ABC transporter ATP-binding protein [Pseudorhodoferax sp.]
MLPLPAQPVLSSTPSTAPVLAVADLTIGFRRGSDWHAAVRGISFEVGAGETLALVGESGSGKSATALAIMGLLPHRTARTAGRVLLDGRDLLALPERALQAVRGDQVAMVFQEPMTSLNPVLPVGEQIAEVLVAHRGLAPRAARAEALALLQRVRIPAAQTRYGEYPHRFSGGMRQRVMIAMALACQPRLLIADEPTTALDVTTQAAILALVRELQQETGMAVLFITHDLGVVSEVADRTVVLRHGAIVEAQATAALFAAPRQDYTRTLIAAQPVLPDLEALADTPVALAPPPDTAPAALDVRGLCTYFDVRTGAFGRTQGRVHAVENVSFQVAPGQTLALVGESGSGKSTIARSIARLVAPTAGQVLVGGQDLLRLGPRALQAARRAVQMVFQDPYGSLDPRMAIGASIAEPLLHHRVLAREQVPARVAELLVQVGLEPGMATRLPHEMSGGQRQRVCIARAIALRPAVLIADEAVSALDVSVKVQIIELLRSLQAAHGIAMLFITHDISAIARLSDRMAVMYQGEIVEHGATGALLRQPRHAYTRRLIEAVPRIGPARRAAAVPVAEEQTSPVRPLDHRPTVRRQQQVGPDHFVVA